MPNHYTTELDVEGDPKDVESFVKRLPPMQVTEYEQELDDDGNVVIRDNGLPSYAPVKRVLELPMFTCETFVPMPSELEDRLPVPDVDGLEGHQYRREDDGTFTVSIQSNVAVAIEQRAKNVATHGHPYWYEWRCEHWGTKWDTYDHDPSATEMGPGWFRTRFQTAWSPPGPAILAASSQHPTLTFHVFGWDEFESPDEGAEFSVRDGRFLS